MRARRRRDGDDGDDEDARDDDVDRDDDDDASTDDDDDGERGMDSDDELEREMAALESVKRERAGARDGATARKSYANNEKGLEASLEGATRRDARRMREGWDGTGTGRRRARGCRDRTRRLTTTVMEPRGAA
jgi:hypothetical protein